MPFLAFESLYFIIRNTSKNVPKPLGRQSSATVMTPPFTLRDKACGGLNRYFFFLLFLTLYKLMDLFAFPALARERLSSSQKQHLCVFFDTCHVQWKKGGERTDYFHKD